MGKPVAETASGPNTCCENGNFGDDHECRKQPGPAANTDPGPFVMSRYLNREELHRAMQSRIDFLEAENKRIDEEATRFTKAVSFVIWLEAFTRTRGYPTGTEWVAIEGNLKDTMQTLKAGGRDE